jgi:hypothetical protein
MRKKLLTLSLGVAALLVMSALPASAGPPQDAAGHWTYMTALTDVREAGCNTFLTINEYDTLTGTFEGGTLDPEHGPTGAGVVVAHCSGSFNYKALLRFEEMTVDGKTGGVVISVNGRLADPTSEWTGNWVIVSATGELEGLRGQGKWWGPGAGGPGLEGHLDYEGQIHFEAN